MIFRSFTALILCLFATQTFASSTQQAWQQFYQRSWSTLSVTLSQKQLAQYSHELLVSDAQYPNFERYSWQDLEKVARTKQRCERPTHYSPILETAIEFELLLCKSEVIPNAWFGENQKLHPAGGSFADRYFKPTDDHPINTNIATLLSGDNPAHPLRKVFSQLSDTGRDSLLNGYRAWLEPDALWLNGELGWKRIPNKIWQPIAQDLNLTINAQQCDFRYNNLCIAKYKPSTNLVVVTSSALSLLLALILARTLYLKRQQHRHKRFVLQLLTHELRTPITSLGMTVDMFKHEFDELNDNAQQAMWRLLEDYQRLTQLTQASKGYLNSEKDTDIMYQEAYVSDWLEHICSEHNVGFNLDRDQSLKLPFYWLSICLNNLIINAKQHGIPPIKVDVSINGKLNVTVSDCGQFPPRWYKWKTKQKENERNMGIGLGLVRHLMTHIGGKLIVQTRPTRITLELPL
ncbi:ATP-binding protein [Vibrio sp. VPAP30]|uniref:ATP-binding protein n=1 Tax=Vibrio sp. VPAP30 TaxID=1647102 RepID=UPI00065997CC|nr:DUF3404 domain-containing protein [Vibrio sp. VPAP30]KLN63455.1 histidine kinase [Vibrio sp. VPAP30]